MLVWMVTDMVERAHRKKGEDGKQRQQHQQQWTRDDSRIEEEAGFVYWPV